MPTDFECSGCGLRFAVGWYHYHSFDDGYGASTLAVCTNCARQHRVEIALDISSASFVDVAVTEIPTAAILTVARHLRRTRSLSPQQAIALVRSPPIHLEMSEPEARALKFKYERLGATVVLNELRSEVVPVSDQQRDRLLIGDGSGQDADLNWRPQDIRGSVTGVTGTFNLHEQACGQCAAAGTLVSDTTQAPRSCPRCLAPVQEKGTWIT
jgi:hypothetical protein